MQTRRQIALVTLLLTLPHTAYRAEEFVLSTDVPAQLGAATYLANQTVLRSAGVYSAAFDGALEGLGPDVNLDAVVILEDGSLLFSADAPFEIAGERIESRDVARFDGFGFARHIAGAGIGLSPAANIDALARDGEGRLAFSLDAPETVGVLTIGPGDLAWIDDGAISMVTSATGLGIPDGADLVGLERQEPDQWYMMFDAPVEIGSTTFLPGDVVRLVGTSESLYFSDPAFPAGSAGSAFSFPGSPGEVRALRASRSGADVELSWLAGCGTSASDYAVFEGTLGAWTSHNPRACSTGGETATVVTPDAGDRYFLVVPRSSGLEGSYGSDSEGTERPRGAAFCTELKRPGRCS